MISFVSILKVFRQSRYTNAPDSVYPSLHLSVVNPTGYSPYEGEVEDYRIYIGEMMFDYGDAPYPFKTLLQDNGARHPIDSTVYLGSGVSADEDGRPDSLAAGDDDDGVVFQGEWVIGDTVIATVTPSIQGYLSVWFYTNPETGGKGEPGDSLSSGSVQRTDAKIEYIEDCEIPIPVPIDAGSGPAYLRFRFSTQPIDSMHGNAFDGEVEDYMIVVGMPTDVTYDHYQKIPEACSLTQNYPNPFNPETNIRYQLKSKGRVVITIHNDLGLCVKTLINEIQPAGTYTVIWDGKNDTGMIVSSGIYFLRMEAKDFIQTQKMVFLK